jgi:hypothetical protein
MPLPLAGLHCRGSTPQDASGRETQIKGRERHGPILRAARVE